MKRLNNLMVLRITPWLVILILSVHSASVYSMPSFARQFKHQFGYIPSCHACHQEGGGTPLNHYGQAFKDQGKNSAAFTLISTLDSDKDGFSNVVEANKKSNPGNATSTPAEPGDWLDLSSLIPKAVQMLFPEASAWKPLDAILTEKDFIRARGMGVTLTAEDENTIYIPVGNRRPIGTALIFPVQHQNNTFFLLMATDRQLNISNVSPLNSEQLPKGLSSDLFKSFIGKPLQSIEALKDESLASKISLAVKRAGILVYIRLKGA